MKKAPGSGFLKVTGILYIVFGGIVIVMGLLVLAAGGIVNQLEAELGAELGVGLSAMSIAGIAVATGVYELIMGILGIVFNNKPNKGIICVVLAVLAIIITIVNIIFGKFEWTSIIGFALPVLYLVGGVLNMKYVPAAPAMEQPPIE